MECYRLSCYMFPDYVISFLFTRVSHLFHPGEGPDPPGWNRCPTRVN
ncbi:MAG: hypothetical protein LUG98_00835 [Tannerellaceae bacterium]|nr:hypothetical protein [Tannerellaceae bacterium]